MDWTAFEDFLAEDEGQMLTNEEDRELKQKHGIDTEMEDYVPHLSDHDRKEIEAGRTSYREIQGMEYGGRIANYRDDKMRIISKRQLERDLDESIGGFDNLINAAEDYDDLVNNLGNPDAAEAAGKLRRQLKEAPEEDAREIVDQLLDDEEIDERAHDFIVDKYF